MTEVVRDGETGFIVRTLAEAVRAVDAAALLDRAAIHRYAAAHFNRECMVDAYLGLYEQLLARRRAGGTLHERMVGEAREAV